METKTTYQLFEELLSANGVTAYSVSKATGISTAFLTLWKQDKTNPKPDKLQKIADHFNVPLTYFYPGAQPEGYYIDPEVAALAEEMASRPGMKTLFEASRDLSEEDLQIVNQLILKLVDKK